MARISEIKVTLKDKSVFDKNEQSLEATIDFDKDYPFMSIKTERWDLLDENGLDNMLESVFKRVMGTYFLMEKEV